MCLRRESNSTEISPNNTCRPLARLDTQVVELAGRNWLASQIQQAGIEVARPERDRGIDLVIYRDLDESGKFVSRPIQIKASSWESFGLSPKYAKFPELLLVYIWHLANADETYCYGLTYQEAVRILEEMGYARTDSWLTGGRHRNRGYSTTRPSERLKKHLEPFEMTPEKWQAMLE